MTGKPLIRISIGSNDFTYTPETEAAGKFGFFGGKRYAYTITVKASGIEVQAVTGARGLHVARRTSPPKR